MTRIRRKTRLRNKDGGQRATILLPSQLKTAMMGISFRAVIINSGGRMPFREKPTALTKLLIRINTQQVATKTRLSSLRCTMLKA